MIEGCFLPETLNLIGGCSPLRQSQQELLHHRNVGLDDILEGDLTHITNAVYHLLPQPLVQMKKCGAVFLGLTRAFTSFLLPSRG